MTSIFISGNISRRCQKIRKDLYHRPCFLNGPYKSCWSWLPFVLEKESLGKMAPNQACYTILMEPYMVTLRNFHGEFDTTLVLTIKFHLKIQSHLQNILVLDNRGELLPVNGRSFENV